MLVRDILPPEKVKRIAREEVLGMKPYKNKRSKYLNLFLRALAAVLLFLFVLFYAPSQVWGENEELVQLAKDELAEAVSLDGAIFEALGLETEPEPPPVDETREEPAEKPAKDYGDKLKLREEKRGGRDRFEMESLGGDMIEFSDRDETSADPYLGIDKWGGEVKLKIRIPHAAAGKKSLDDNRLRIKNGEYEVEVYPRAPEEITEEIAGSPHSFTINDEGGVEFDVLLDSVPTNNVFEFPVEGEGLEFYYQAALDPEHPTWADLDGDGTADFFRPEVVVGSYAVYYADQEGLAKGEEAAEKYKTGKAFHIYRPRVTDAAGNAVWADLNYDEARSVLSVTVDAAWLAAAAYPVRVDPNIGTTTVGASAAQISSAGNIISNGAISGANGTVTSMSAYVYRVTAGSMKANVYSSTYYPLHASGTANGTIPSSGAWVTMAFTAGPDISSSGSYYLALWNQYSYYVYADSTSGHTSLMDAETWGTSWSSPAGTTTFVPMNYSIYATYTESRTAPAGVGISGGSMLMF